jgi:glutaredoxin-like YruB-family protein
VKITGNLFHICESHFIQILTGMVMNQQPKVIVFSTPTCSFCTAAKRYFREQNIRFTDVDVSRDQSAARDMLRKTGQMGVPVILINNQPIVGFDKPKIQRLLNLKN